jgi:ribonuclease Z
LAFSLTILGSTGALPASGRFPTSQYLTIQNHHFLIDCGEGAQMQMTRYSIPVTKIDHIFISHLHGDHYLGLMPFLFSLHLNKRKNDLHLYSPKGLDEIITLQLKYSKSALNYKIVFHPFDPTTIATLLEDETMTVETIPLLHKLECAGFLFREKIKQRRIDKDRLHEGIKLQHIIQLKKGEDIIDENGKILHRNTDYTLPPRPSLSYAYCSDTAWNEKMIAQIKEVNLLYHESTFLETEIERAIETKHSTAAQAATMASRAKVDKLLLGHFSARYKNLEMLLHEAKAIFENSELAIEGASFILEE